MAWIKKGRIISTETIKKKIPWMHKRISLPYAEVLYGDVYRVYFYSQDANHRAQIGYFEIDLNRPAQIMNLSEAPIFKLGELGAFDDQGIMPSWIINKADKKYMYYTGWSLGVTVPFYFYIGLAVSIDGGKSFSRYSKSPILGRNEFDPFLTASPCIIIESNLWRMWYVSCIKWIIENGIPKHYYLIKYAESRDGIHWLNNNNICIDFKDASEYAIARPCVIHDSKIYKMWYSYRGEKYRIGYAESNDGIKWTRKDDIVGITPSLSGWDSESICYAYIFNHKNKTFMLYCGNHYGDSGIGIAELV